MIIKPSGPIVDARGNPTAAFNAWLTQVTELQILEGAGSPEGVIYARENTLYKDTSGTASAIVYIKKTDASDATGWVLV